MNDKQRRNLLDLHDHALELANAVARRLVANESDNHPNSWWRYYEARIRVFTARVAAESKQWEDGRGDQIQANQQRD